jgi:hypothetical protein
MTDARAIYRTTGSAVLVPSFRLRDLRVLAHDTVLRRGDKSAAVVALAALGEGVSHPAAVVVGRARARAEILRRFRFLRRRFFLLDGEIDWLPRQDFVVEKLDIAFDLPDRGFCLVDCALAAGDVIDAVMALAVTLLEGDGHVKLLVRHVPLLLRREVVESVAGEVAREFENLVGAQLLEHRPLAPESVDRQIAHMDRTVHRNLVGLEGPCRRAVADDVAVAGPLVTVQHHDALLDDVLTEAAGAGSGGLRRVHHESVVPFLIGNVKHSFRSTSQYTLRTVSRPSLVDDNGNVGSAICAVCRRRIRAGSGVVSFAFRSAPGAYPRPPYRCR